MPVSLIILSQTGQTTAAAGGWGYFTADLKDAAKFDKTAHFIKMFFFFIF